MKVVVAMDSWKGSLTSIEAGEAVRRGIHRVFDEADVSVYTLADGGEGTVSALIASCKGRIEQTEVTGPLGTKISCQYGIIDETNTAIIEMSAAAGIMLVPYNKRNPMLTTTFGVGELIKTAISKGCRSFIIGIGGSATNDGGIGMLQALGYDILDSEGRQVTFGASGLEQIAKIDNANVIPEIRECSFRVACDVSNPLCGENGCSAVFGPQKGATASMIIKMDEWLKRYAEITSRLYPETDCFYPGSGAAGGLGFAFNTYLKASMESGISIVLYESGIEDTIKDANIVITGEGCTDGQTAMGKAPYGVAALAEKYNKTVLVFSGSVSGDLALCNENGMSAIFPVLRETVSLKEAMKPEVAKKNIEACVEQVFRLIQSIKVES